MPSFVQKTILSTADVARLFKVTETTVKRWADEGTLRCQKTPGGHRKYEIRNVVEFADRNNFEPVGVLTIPGNDKLGQRIQIAMLGRDFSELVTAFVEKALSPDRAELFAFLSYLYQHRVQLWEIYDLVICPGMTEIGERWAQGEIGINHEHRASYETLDALSKLSAQIHIKPSTGRTVLCTCLGNELHEIGLRCASYLFESKGWGTHYLGAGIPHESIVAAISELKPDVVCLSVTNSWTGGAMEGVLEHIAVAARKIRARVILGGRTASAVRARPGLLDAVHSSSRELLGYLERYERINNGSRGEKQ